MTSDFLLHTDGFFVELNSLLNGDLLRRGNCAMGVSAVSTKRKGIVIQRAVPV